MRPLSRKVFSRWLDTFPKKNPVFNYQCVIYVRFCRLVLGALQNCLQLISHDIFFMQKKLVEVLTTHYYLLHEDGIHFTPLAQVCSIIYFIHHVSALVFSVC